MAKIKEKLSDLALSIEEYNLIVSRLGRNPTDLELGLFGSLWSEHCSYKHSKPLLKSFTTSSERVLISSGEENAGAVDIGNNKAIVMKIESHNHPSAIEPYEGAATGIGGIVRDILAMGARPIALLNSLRFGTISESRNKFLLKGVVAGISGYGNCIGVPNVGGEVNFSECYSQNPLVNVMCVGLVEKDSIVKAIMGQDNIIILAGSDTGRDGIHGASGLASQSFEDSNDLRPAVQVGDPFTKKLLIEACLEIAKRKIIDGIQDLGAGGLSTAIIEVAERSNCGVEINVENIIARETKMSPYELMLSESQERMLIFSTPENENEIRKLLEKWGLQSSVIGKAIPEKIIKVKNDNKVKAKINIPDITKTPEYVLKDTKPMWLSKLQKEDLNQFKIPNFSPKEILLKLLSSPNIASKEFIYEQFDHQVQTNTIIGPGSDAAVLRLKSIGVGLALTTDGNSKFSYLDPYIGGLISVAEACRNLCASGAEPIAITDCLNFPDPEKPGNYYQLSESIRGIAKASKKFNVPVISGNVSLYNQSRNKAIFPTPIIGAVGIINEANKAISIGFKNENDVVILLGSDTMDSPIDSLAGSDLIELTHQKIVGKPKIDLDHELLVQKTLLSAIQKNLVESAHDISNGGLAITIAESCISGNLGFNGTTTQSDRWDTALFGENQSRIIISVKPEKLSTLKGLLSETKCPFLTIGFVGGKKLIFPKTLQIDVNEISEHWKNGLEKAVQ